MADEKDFTPSEDQMRQAYWHFVYEKGINLDRRDVDAEFTRGMEKIKEQVLVEEREKAALEIADRIRISDGMIQRTREAMHAQTGHYPTITSATEILSAALDGEQADREPKVEIVREEGKPARCKVWRDGVLLFDGRDYSADLEDREPSDAEVEAAADAIIEASFGQELPEAPVDLARAALLASQEVRNRG